MVRVRPTPRHSTAALCLSEYTDRPPRRKGVSREAAEHLLRGETEAYTSRGSSNGSL